jgi:hypothetical protein
MGYQARGKVYALKFEAFDGLEVRAATCSLGQLLSVGEEIDRARAGAGLGEVRDLTALFDSKLRSWNCEDENEEPISIADGVCSLDADVALNIVLAWCDVMTSFKLDHDLGKDSTAGDMSAVASIPMTAA